MRATRVPPQPTANGARAHRTPDVAAGDTNVPDVALEFARWRHAARRSFWFWLVRDIDALHRIELWDFDEDGACHLWYRTQHESEEYTSHQYPASRDARITYYDESAVPENRPTTYTERKASYPLRHTRDLRTCHTCAGRGRVTCGRCHGSGHCQTCGGSGTWRSGNETRRCSTCGGNGRCDRCHGSGQVTCGTCDGEGRLLFYRSKEYHWWVRTDDPWVLTPHLDREALRRTVTRVRATGGSVPVDALSVQHVLHATGVVNARVEGLLTLANERRAQLEAQIAARSQRILFQERQYSYVPLAYFNMFVGRRYGQFFAAGTEARQEVLRPPIPISEAKAVAWAGLAAFAGLLIYVVGLDGVVDGVAMRVACAACAVLIALGIAAGVREGRRTPPARWVVFDSADHGAWQFAFLLAQAVSRAGLARVVDAWFTTLLDPPRPGSLESRSSFTYTLVNGREPVASRSSCRTELVVVGTRASAHYASTVREIARESARLTWIAGGRTPAELDAVIADHLLALGPAARGAAVSVVCDADEPPWSADALPRTSAAVGRPNVAVLAFPMGRMCDEVRLGVISPACAEALSRLAAYGVAVAAAAPATPNASAPTPDFHRA